MFTAHLVITIIFKLLFHLRIYKACYIGKEPRYWYLPFLYCFSLFSSNVSNVFFSANREGSLWGSIHAYCARRNLALKVVWNIISVRHTLRWDIKHVQKHVYRPPHDICLHTHTHLSLPIYLTFPCHKTSATVSAALTSSFCCPFIFNLELVSSNSPHV